MIEADQLSDERLRQLILSTLDAEMLRVASECLASRQEIMRLRGQAVRHLQEIASQRREEEHCSDPAHAAAVKLADAQLAWEEVTPNDGNWPANDIVQRAREVCHVALSAYRAARAKPASPDTPVALGVASDGSEPAAAVGDYVNIKTNLNGHVVALLHQDALAQIERIVKRIVTGERAKPASGEGLPVDDMDRIFKHCRAGFFTLLGARGPREDVPPGRYDLWGSWEEAWADLEQRIRSALARAREGK